MRFCLKKKIKILNYLINPITIKEFIKKLEHFINLKNSKYVCVSAVHGAVESVFNKKYKLAHDKADIAVPAGSEQKPTTKHSVRK